LNKQHTTYQKQQLTSYSAALERLLECYNIGIRAAVQKDVTKATEVLDLLERSLDASGDPSIALSLRGIYHDCRRLLESEDWAHYAENLERLKGLWTAKERVQQAML
jgi:flagellin-specific chaperone FliS